MKANDVSAADLANMTLAEAPAAAPAAEPAPAPAAAPGAPAPELDVYGRAFDPGKFRYEKDSLGRWKNLRGGKTRADWQKAKASRAASPGAVPAPAPPVVDPSFVAPDPEPAPAPAPPSGPDKYDLSADVFTRAFYASADSLFAGQGEWAPDNDEEHTQLRNAAAAYMRAKGLDDLPPGAALCLAVGTYVAKRIQRPRTNTRWRMIVAYWKTRMAAWRSGRRISKLNHVEMPAN